MARHRKRRDEEEPGEEEIMIVPLVDIVFLLLIFFLVTASLKKPIREWDLDLPSDSYATTGAYREDEIVITFQATTDKNGKTTHLMHLSSTQDGTKEKVTNTELSKIFEAAAKRTPIPHVRLVVDRSVPMYSVAEVIDRLRAYNLRSVSFRARDQ